MVILEYIFYFFDSKGHFCKFRHQRKEETDSWILVVISQVPFCLFSSHSKTEHYTLTKSSATPGNQFFSRGKLLDYKSKWSKHSDSQEMDTVPLTTKIMCFGASDFPSLGFCFVHRKIRILKSVFANVPCTYKIIVFLK